MAKKNVYRKKLEVLQEMFLHWSEIAEECGQDDRAEVWYLAADWCARAAEDPEDPEELNCVMYWA